MTSVCMYVQESNRQLGVGCGVWGVGVSGWGGARGGGKRVSREGDREDRGWRECKGSQEGLLKGN